jgi:hypothetical protein
MEECKRRGMDRREENSDKIVEEKEGGELRGKLLIFVQYLSTRIT